MKYVGGSVSAEVIGGTDNAVKFARNFEQGLSGGKDAAYAASQPNLSGIQHGADSPAR